jgi:DNA-binding LacI/PurR family transcriptional regulator
MARAATRRVLDRIETPDLPPVVMEFPIDLVPRESCREILNKKEE